MPLVRMDGLITRQDARNAPKAYYVFGDNMLRVGLGGLAKELRGEPNAIGIPTKWAPSMAQNAFFSDECLRNFEVVSAIGNAFLAIEKAMRAGAVVFYPAKGVGSGMARLPEKAPAVNAWIEAVINGLERRYG